MSGAGLTVVSIGPGATVQDLGRPGHMHEGVPPGGALVPELLIAANRSLGNSDGDPAMEIPNGARVRAEGAVVVSIDGSPHHLAPGSTLDVVPKGEAVHYLALAGGIDVPEILGGRGTLLVAGLGGFEGRALRDGDRLHARTAGPSFYSIRRVTVGAFRSQPIRVVLGPDPFPPGSVEGLFTKSFRVGSFDRAGMRLAGDRLPPSARDSRAAMPMIRGATQVAGDGSLIVLGPDGPTTGGYRVIAAVCTADQGVLARTPVGGFVRFCRS
jgi:5-oxoprolinase (ATP-hydrolysing) subunit C